MKKSDILAAQMSSNGKGVEIPGVVGQKNILLFLHKREISNITGEKL